MNRQLHTQEDLHADRKYKDRLFRLVFSDKKDLLDLYNAVNGTDYQNPEELEVNTLENVLYLSMKNDLSFLIDTELNLYEHQSTCNPNMPMRGFLYFGDLYSALWGSLQRLHCAPGDQSLQQHGQAVSHPSAYRLLQWDQEGTRPEGPAAFRSV